LTGLEDTDYVTPDGLLIGLEDTDYVTPDGQTIALQDEPLPNTYMEGQ
jgi:hypothetical protein